MIKKILEIKKLGIFGDFRWNTNMPSFDRFNLIYGWNGSGKTTLSQFFSSLEKGELEEYPDIKYKIETDEGEYIQGLPYIKKIRVFNQHYINQNIDIVSCKANPIFILGKDHIELAELIAKDEKNLRGNPELPNDLGKLKEREIKKKEREQKEGEKSDLFSSVAKNISTQISGVSARNYRKPEAEKDFRSLNSKLLLGELQLEQCMLVLWQQEMPMLEKLSIKGIEVTAKKIIDEADRLLKQSVEVVVIARLQENPNISQWVEQGFDIHRREKSKNCEFCGQELPEDRINYLAGYFNVADRKIKEDVDRLLTAIDQFQKSIENLVAIDKANFFNDLQNDYLLQVNELNKAKRIVLEEIFTFRREVDNKKLHTTESIELMGNIKVKSFINAIKTVNSYIIKHNKKSQNFSTEKEKVQKLLKNHYLSGIFDRVKSLELEIHNLDKEIAKLENGDPDDPEDIGINQLLSRIEKNKNKISQSGLACTEINKQLETFLGRRELVFETTEDGYVLKRYGEIAKNLSEGEKTAVAFVYFTINLKDRDFDKSDGIVVIDDPISSLDSNSLFQAFSFLKNAVQDRAQVFIFTHNFDFLQLLITWLKHVPNNRSKYYMIKNLLHGEKREAKLDVLDKLLRDYSSEYQYLFKTLYEFKPDGTIDSVYHLPNIARKVLENFLMIMVPDNKSPYKKLEQINFDNNKKAAIYKFTNDQSHITGKGFDPSLVSEAQNVVSYLLEMMKAVFPKHYEVLENSLSNQSNL